MVTFACVDDQYMKEKSLRKMDVMILLAWCDRQPHLPRMTEMETALFLHSCFYSSEAAKKCIDYYFTNRTNWPEFFGSYNPLCEQMQATLDTITFCELPKRTPKGEIIGYLRLRNLNPDLYSFDQMVKQIDMLSMLSLYQYGCSPGYVFVMDVEGAQLMHLFKSRVLSIKRYLFYAQNSMPLRLNSIHFVNSVSFMDRIIDLVKPFMKKELQDHLHAHSGNNETIFAEIPRDCLPKECGGLYENLEESYVEQRKYLEENSEFFVQLGKKCVDESKRPGRATTSNIMFGVEGTFKKLGID